MKFNTLFSLLVASLMSPAVAFAADPIELKYATVAPEKTPWGAHFLDRVAAAETAADGSLKVNMFFSSQLGDEPTVVNQVVRGRIDIAGQSNTATALVVPEFSLLAAPFLFRDAAQSDCVFDNHVKDIFGPLLEAKGLILLSYMEVGYPSIYSKTPVATAEDLKDLKIRVAPSKPYPLYFNAAGAAALPLAGSDSVPAIKTGRVNALHTSTVFGLAVGYHKLGSNVTYLPSHHDIGTVVMSKKTWDKLTPEQREAVSVMGEEVNALRKSIRDTQVALLAKAENEDGATVFRPQGEDLEGFRVFAEQAQQELVASIGESAVPIWARIQDAVKACGG
ncbi:TRAP transporter substrate-binding protein [Sedimentitalea todarodis]|uniref:TRAP transporter substrate-binding protein DctP n=1 Tax=Sedimentitalea todarodis TaxID=1631240 RepID=A0ABU3VLW1_9RHOB|nr:TRAP transporter substrate-binding protein DctP [Sedimentitalea todarodis]MDU9007093.1 TRAP transporter substrate-binding protein DctP [Sedimentitalea todarodis]